MGKVQWMRARGLLPQYNGTEGSIREDNMRRMRAAGQLSDRDRNIMEMQSSDEEGGAPQPSQQVSYGSLKFCVSFERCLVGHLYGPGGILPELQLTPIAW